MIDTQPSVCTVWDPRHADGLPFGSHSMQHGTAVFEGIRCYRTPGGPAFLGLGEHLARLLRSARLLGLPHDYDEARLRDLADAAVAAGGEPDLYVRPVIFTPEPRLQLDLRGHQFTCAIEVWPGASAPGTAREPVRLTVSRWRRPGATVVPPGTKATGLYVLSALARTEAAAAGFDDAIQLDPESGRVAEATAANIFLVTAGALVTPWTQDSLLPGITRGFLLGLARRAGLAVTEGPVQVADLHAAEEIILTGTACELVPVAEVDGHRTDPAGPVFTMLAGEFGAAARGERPECQSWLTPARPRA